MCILGKPQLLRVKLKVLPEHHAQDGSTLSELLLKLGESKAIRTSQFIFAEQLSGALREF